MVHKIAFCIELMRNKKKAKREMRKAKSGGVGRCVWSPLEEKNQHQLEWHALKSNFPHCNCCLENAGQFTEDLLVIFVFSIYHSQE